MSDRDKYDVVVVGAGYVGIPTALGVAWGSLGNRARRVLLLDASRDRVRELHDAEQPLGEPLIRDRMRQIKVGNLAIRVVDRPADLAIRIADADPDVVVVAVWTPLSNLDCQGLDVADVLRVLKACTPRAVAIVRSTLDLDGLAAVRTIRGIGPLVVCPEFLRECHAVIDTENPSRFVVGSDDLAALKVAEDVLQPRGYPSLRVDPVSAVLIKVASNAMLAARVRFADAVAGACEAHGGNAALVLTGVGLDPRVGPHHLSPGLGVGGPCLPKDEVAFQALSGWQVVSESRTWAVSQRIMAALPDVAEPRIMIWGAGFKPGCADHRDSPAVRLAATLIGYVDQLPLVSLVDPAMDGAALRDIFHNELAGIERITVADAERALFVAANDQQDCMPDAFVLCTPARVGELVAAYARRIVRLVGNAKGEVTATRRGSQAIAAAFRINGDTKTIAYTVVPGSGVTICVDGRAVVSTRHPPLVVDPYRLIGREELVQLVDAGFRVMVPGVREILGTVLAADDQTNPGDPDDEPEVTS